MASVNKAIALAIKIAQALDGQNPTATDPADEVQAQAHALVGRRVLVRDNRAGVYCGTLESADVREGLAVLTDCRHVYYWTGAAATTGIAARGVGGGSKIGPVTERIDLLDTVSLMPMTDAAWETISNAPEWMS